MEADRTSPAEGCPGRRAGGRSPRHQRHRARAEERLSLVRLPARLWSSTTIYNRFVRWARRGVWENLFRELAGSGRSIRHAADCKSGASIKPEAAGRAVLPRPSGPELPLTEQPAAPT